MVFKVRRKDTATFFKERFGKDPEHDQTYYKEWEGRFDKGPEPYMDSKSKEVYHKLKKEKRI